MSFKLLVLLITVNTNFGLYNQAAKENYYRPYSYEIPPQNLVCGIRNGIWKEFTLDQFDSQKKSGQRWLFFSLGRCPQPIDDLTNIFKPICAKSGNKFRKFNNRFSLHEENLTSNKKWNDTACPINHMTICGSLDNEIRIFRDKFALRLSKCLTGKDWRIETCPDLRTPICINPETISNDTLSWTIIACSSEDVTNDKRGDNLNDLSNKNRDTESLESTSDANLSLESLLLSTEF